MTKRAGGILCPISSISSKYGIGCFSKEAYDFVDFLKKAGQTYWQILPLGPTGYGDSPYQSFSTFAGNPYFICLTELAEQGLLTLEECDNTDFGSDPARIDYGKLYENRYKILYLAYKRFMQEPDSGYYVFVRNNAFWLEDYSVFCAIKEKYDGKGWIEWDESLQKRDPGAIAAIREELQDSIGFQRFMQYMFYSQWDRLHEYANANGIRIIGDLPIYAAYDSSDAWAAPELFQFGSDKRPTSVAGCPPDGFSADGQLWGNPLYDWEYHRSTDYAWWIRRMAHCFRLYDTVRIDHFRAFDEYYSIPYGDVTAKNGHWEKGPGADFFAKLSSILPEPKIIAEDLGFLTDSVHELLKSTGFPGMKVLQFAFDSREDSDYLPHNYGHNCVVYTGTHDNETTLGWIQNINDHDRTFARRYINSLNTSYGGFVWDFIRSAQASTADTCIIPIQDYLVKGNEARINRPATLGNNWQWRMVPNELSEELTNSIFEMTKLYGRCRTGGNI